MTLCPDRGPSWRKQKTLGQVWSCGRVSGQAASTPRAGILPSEGGVCVGGALPSSFRGQSSKNCLGGPSFSIPRREAGGSLQPLVSHPSVSSPFSKRPE